MRLNKFERSFSIHHLAANVMMVFGTVQRNINTKIFMFQKINNGIVEQSGICIYSKTQTEIFAFSN